MNKIYLPLSSLLGLQIILIIGLYWSNSSNATEKMYRILPALTEATINKIIIQGDGQTAVLEKQSNEWQLPALGNLHVDSNQLETALNKLSSLEYRWPIATTKSSHLRFKVSDDDFQRRIKLYNGGDVVVDMFLGSSPGYRKIYGRLAGSNEVYSLKLNNFDFPTENKRWVNKSLLAVKGVTRIQTSHYILKKIESNWFLEDNSGRKDAMLDQNKAQQLEQAFASISILDMVDDTLNFELKSWTTFNVVGDKNWTYQWLEKDNRYYVRRDDIKQVFTISQYDYERIATRTASDLHRKIDAVRSDQKPLDDVLSSEAISDLSPAKNTIK